MQEATVTRLHRGAGRLGNRSGVDFGEHREADARPRVTATSAAASTVGMGLHYDRRSDGNGDLDGNGDGDDVRFVAVELLVERTATGDQR